MLSFWWDNIAGTLFNIQKSTAPGGIQVKEIEVRQDHNIRKLFLFQSEESSLGRLHVWEALVLFKDEGCPFERLFEKSWDLDKID